MAASFLTSSLPHIPSGKPPQPHVIRLIGPLPTGANVIRVVYKCDVKPDAVPAVHSLAGYALHPHTTAERGCNSFVPSTSVSHCIPPSYVYDSNSHKVLNHGFPESDSSPLHSDISIDSLSVCNSPCEPNPTSENVFDCDDPISELMRLDIPDVDDSSLFADILMGDEFFDNTGMDSICDQVFSDFTNVENESVKAKCEASVRTEKKRSSNRQAALRYRERKRLQKQGFSRMLCSVMKENERLRSELFAEYQSASLLIDLVKSIL